MREFLAILTFTILIATLKPNGAWLWFLLYLLLVTVGVAIELDKN